MPSTPSPEEWTRILDGDVQPALKVADDRGPDPTTAYEADEAALEDAVLVEDPDAGGFGRVRTAGENASVGGDETDGQRDAETERRAAGEPRANAAVVGVAEAVAFARHRTDEVVAPTQDLPSGTPRPRANLWTSSCTSAGVQASRTFRESRLPVAPPEGPATVRGTAILGGGQQSRVVLVWVGNECRQASTEPGGGRCDGRGRTRRAATATRL